jgi:hypothetical protein
MAGLYPEDQTISLFGKEVRWPRLDLSTGKFTDGSFSDPLIEPSYIPAETINLILDNLANFITGMGQTPNNYDPNQLFKAIKNFQFPVGKMVEQLPDEPSPIECGWPGDWEIWSARAVEYKLSTSAPPSAADYYTLVGNSIPAGNTPKVCYHKSGDSKILYQFISQSTAYTVPSELDPVRWTELTSTVIAERQKCGNLLTEEDYEIGDIVTSGTHTGKYVVGVIVPGGKFRGVEGGFRPPYVSGGVQSGRIIDLKGSIPTRGPGGYLYPAVDVSGATGVFEPGPASTAKGISGSTVNAYPPESVIFKASRAVPTGPDNAPQNLSTRLWRRVA